MKLTQTLATATTVAEAYLALLKQHGIDYLYVNAGTDFAPLIEAYARRHESELDFPQPIVAAHEIVAMGMAHGYYMMTGRPQAVMVHVGVGTANALCGLMSAARDHVPLLFTAGRTPLHEEGPLGARSSYIHWAQEMYDQAAMTREFVKWDYELRDGAQVAQVVARACSLMMAHPRGPVYLTLPREVLAASFNEFVPFEAGDMPAPAEPHPDPDAVRRAAELLARTDHPLIIPIASGQDPTTVSMLENLAERFALPVVEHQARFVCLSSEHPMHLGFDIAPLIGEADVLLALEADVPWMPTLARPRPDAKVIHAGIDPLFSRYPMRSFRADVSVTSSMRAFLPALTAALEHACAGQMERIAARRQWIAEQRCLIRARVEAERRKDEQAGGLITKTYLNRCLDAVKPNDAIVVNEYWVARQHLTFTLPATYFQYPPVGGLGWGLPAALGAQHALPERTVIATVGDGAYIFANPAACHQVAAAQHLPVLTIVCNNQSWEAVKRTAWRMYPQGAVQKYDDVPMWSLAPAPQYEKYAEASGGYGEVVTERAALPDALARALKVVREERRQALLNVICAQ